MAIRNSVKSSTAEDKRLIDASLAAHSNQNGYCKVCLLLFTEPSEALFPCEVEVVAQIALAALNREDESTTQSELGFSVGDWVTSPGCSDLQYRVTEIVPAVHKLLGLDAPGWVYFHYDRFRNERRREFEDYGVRSSNYEDHSSKWHYVKVTDR